MSEQPDHGPDIVDVTDSLEAVSIFRAWKSLFLLILIVCMFLIQGIFWITDLGLVDTSQTDPNAIRPAQTGASESPSEMTPAEPASASDAGKVLSGVTPLHLTRALGLINSIAFLVAVLFCLTLMFSMLITIVSRLGGSDTYRGPSSCP